MQEKKAHRKVSECPGPPSKDWGTVREKCRSVRRKSSMDASGLPSQRVYSFGGGGEVICDVNEQAALLLLRAEWDKARRRERMWKSVS